MEKAKTGILRGKTALVTGGSRGIGRAVVARFLQEGATVYAISRSQGSRWGELEKLAEQGGGELFFREADLLNQQEFISLLSQILKESDGPVDILVNNAGITRDGLLFGMTDEAWHEVLTVNLTSAFHACQIVGRAMSKARSGSIINISSIVGVIGNPGQANYVASKAGLIGLTKSLARELGARNVRVNAVAPGFITTEMTESLNESQKQAILPHVPLKRLGSVEDVAAGVLFLASPDSSYISGHVLKIAGGMGM